MKRSIILMLLLAAGCASDAQRETTRAETGGVVNYADTRHGIRLTYDSKWKTQNFLKPKGALLVLVTDDDAAGLPPTVSLVAQPQDSKGNSPDLRDMEQRMIERAQKQIDSFAVVDASDTTVAGQPARRVIYTGKKLGVSMQVMNILAIHNNRGYAIAYMADPSAFDSRRSDVDRIVQSMEWIK
jgi:hypothetical protein